MNWWQNWQQRWRSAPAGDAAHTRAEAALQGMRRSLDDLQHLYAAELAESRRLASQLRDCERQRDRNWRQALLIPAERRDWQAQWQQLLGEAETGIAHLHQAQADQSALLIKLRSAIVRLEDRYAGARAQLQRDQAHDAARLDRRRAHCLARIAELEARFDDWQQRLPAPPSSALSAPKGPMPHPESMQHANPIHPPSPGQSLAVTARPSGTEFPEG